MEGGVREGGHRLQKFQLPCNLQTALSSSLFSITPCIDRSTEGCRGSYTPNVFVLFSKFCNVDFIHKSLQNLYWIGISLLR